MTQLGLPDLPDVNAVEVRIRGRWGKTVKIEGPVAQLIADLWRSLPPGEQKRCHMPVYELQFLNGAKLVCSATVCWKCNNIYGTMGAQSIAFEFDGMADISQKLLSEIRSVYPGPSEV